MKAIRTFIPRIPLFNILDEFHEQRIERARLLLLSATEETRHQRGREFMDLIRQRSPERVAKMEREKGLI